MPETILELWALVGFPAGCVLGAVVALLVNQHFGRMEYRWACPAAGCAFEVQATDMDDCDHYATMHERGAHQ